MADLFSEHTNKKQRRDKQLRHDGRLNLARKDAMDYLRARDWQSGWVPVRPSGEPSWPGGSRARQRKLFPAT